MNRLGCGFLEKVYENALACEVGKLGLKVEQQKKIKFFYEDVEVGFYEPDLLIENLVVVELKTVKNLEEVHKAQSLNYLTHLTRRTEPDSFPAEFDKLIAEH
jgi:hypothetical protein